MPSFPEGARRAAAAHGHRVRNLQRSRQRRTYPAWASRPKCQELAVLFFILHSSPGGEVSMPRAGLHTSTFEEIRHACP
jgi:hypothetical protein